MKHLFHTRLRGCAWCGDENVESQDFVMDPYDADCPACLREAAEYGAAAAMRCAAVESMSSTDDELREERDHALKQLSKIERELHAVGYFFCHGCERITSARDAGMQVPVRLCRDCVPA